MPRRFIQRFFEAPAVAVEVTVQKSEIIIEKVERVISLKKAKGFWDTLGPGLITGASDDDPSGIATYSQTGAQYGFSLLWLSLFTFPLMAVVQEMCARIGMVTHKGLAANIRRHYSAKILFFCTTLLFFANTFNLGANLGAMAKATQLLSPGMSFPFLVAGFAALCLLLEIFLSYRVYARYLKWLALILLAYVFSGMIVNLPWGQVLTATVVPHMDFSKEQLILICAILGTTISPYLFFWQTSQEVEEKHAGVCDPKTKICTVGSEDMRKMKVDVWFGMLLSNIVMFFIIATCAATLYTHGITNITTAAQAAEALRPIAGDFAYVLFALGIIGTGMLAVPVLAGSSAYALSESFKWKNGLHYKLKDAHAFYGVMIIGVLLGLVMNFLAIDPIKALIYSAVANGLVAPIVLFLVVQLSSDPKVMGEHVNSRGKQLFGWAIVLVMAIACIAALIAIFS